MNAYFKSSEFWQCFVFWLWSLTEVAIISMHLMSVSRSASLLSGLLLVISAVFLTQAFTSIVGRRIENPDAGKSPEARIFVYCTGVLAVALQIVYTVLRMR